MVLIDNLTKKKHFSQWFLTVLIKNVAKTFLFDLIMKTEPDPDWIWIRSDQISWDSNWFRPNLIRIQIRSDRI